MFQASPPTGGWGAIYAAHTACSARAAKAAKLPGVLQPPANNREEAS